MIIVLEIMKYSFFAYLDICISLIDHLYDMGSPWIDFEPKGSLNIKEFRIQEKSI
jgi:hypothetical protein